MIEMLKSKIHSAKVTGASIDYEGSLGMDKDFMDAVGFLNFEAVEIYNVTNGARLKTYAIPLPRGSRRIESNGAAAHLIREGDRVIIASYHRLNDEQLYQFKGPLIALMDFPTNIIKRVYQPDWQRADGSKELIEFDRLQNPQDQFRVV